MLRSISKSPVQRSLLAIEQLERRLLLTNVSGPIAADTTWSLANSPYVLVGNVVIQPGATLTIAPGVAVSAAFGGVGLSTAAGGILSATGATFSGAPVSIATGGTALLTGNIFAPNSSLEIGAGSVGNQLNGNTFHDGVLTIFPEFAPHLANNTFISGANVSVRDGVIDQVITWPKVNGLAVYRLIGNVTIQGAGAKLTMDPSLTLSAAFGGVGVSAVAGGTLSATGVTFSGAPVAIGAGGTALLTSNLFAANSSLEIAAGSVGNQISGNTFHDDVLTIYPEYAPNVANNAFIVGASVRVRGGVIDEALNWPKVNGLAGYDLLGTVTVQGAGASLTVAPDLSVSGALGLTGLQVAPGATLSADGVTFDTAINIQNDANATINFSTFLRTLTISNTAMIDISYNDFSAPTPRIFAAGVPSLRNVNLRNNWWGTRTAIEIDPLITDNLDEPARPRVDYEPLLAAPPRRTDLVAAALSVDSVPAHPLAFQPGDQLTLHFQIRNDSPLANVPETRALFSLNSTAAIPGSKTIELRVVPPIAPQTALPPDVLQFTMPPANDPFWTQQPLTTPRYYTVTMRVDALGQLSDWDEPNNIKTLEIPIAANVPGTVIPGDFDFNGIVRSADLAVWAGSFGKRNFDAPLLGDAQADHVVDGRDFLAWQRSFGLPAASAISELAVAVPTQVAAQTAAPEENATARATLPLQWWLLPSFNFADSIDARRHPISKAVLDDVRSNDESNSCRSVWSPTGPDSGRGPRVAPFLRHSSARHGERDADPIDAVFGDLGQLRSSRDGSRAIDSSP